MSAQIRRNRSFCVGIIGGMGPAAGNRFAQLLVDSRSVDRDQDHIPFVHINATGVPDRTSFLLDDGDDPVPSILLAIKKAKRAGATVACITCNTSHAPAIFDRIKNSSPLPLVSLIDVTAAHLSWALPRGEKVGILATDGTIQTELYQNAIKSCGFEVVLPDVPQQKQVMEIIYEVKKHGALPFLKDNLQDIMQTMKERHHVQYFIAGCTELSLFDDLSQPDLNIIDPMRVSAQHIINCFQSDSETRPVLERIWHKTRSLLSRTSS